jgi:hypothetical protein
LLDDSTEGNDATIDGGGIILRSSNGSKDLVWEQTTNSWTSNVDVDLEENVGNPLPSYNIGGTSVLTKTTLGSTVTSALGVTILGVQSELTVDDIKLDSATIERINGTGLNIVAGGDIIVDSQNITGLAEPTTSSDAATKNYVDTQIDLQTLVMSMDITGLTDPDDITTNNGPTNSIATLLENLKPASSVENGAYMRILATSYSGSTVSGISVDITTSPDTSGVLTKSSVSVDKNNVVNDVTVIQDISESNTASGIINLTATRYIYIYQASAGIWNFQSRILQTVT